MKKNLANYLTLLNLLCGCFALVAVFRMRFDIALWLVFLAAVFDFLDGFVARWMKAEGEMGKQLDSLADMVTFGVVPGFILYKMIIFSIGIRKPFLEEDHMAWHLAYLGLIIPLASAWRLAKFNIDTRQTAHFLGLPTPANALFWAGLPVIAMQTKNPALNDWLSNPIFLVVLGLLFSLLLVSEIPLLSLKFKHYKWQGNEGKYILLLSSLGLLLTLQLQSLPAIIIIYVILSLIFKKQIVAHEIQSRN